MAGVAVGQDGQRKVPCMVTDLPESAVGGLEAVEDEPIAVGVQRCVEEAGVEFVGRSLEAELGRTDGPRIAGAVREGDIHLGGCVRAAARALDDLDRSGVVAVERHGGHRGGHATGRRARRHGAGLHRGARQYRSRGRCRARGLRPARPNWSSMPLCERRGTDEGDRKDPSGRVRRHLTPS